MNWNYHWRSRPDIARLEHTIDQLRTELIKLRREMSNKEQYIGRLKVLCHERTTRIDDLRATIDDLRAANQKLDAEAEHLAALIAAPDAAMLAPK
jgi:chromosome segregation ATPase